MAWPNRAVSRARARTPGSDSVKLLRRHRRLPQAQRFFRQRSTCRSPVKTSRGRVVTPLSLTRLAGVPHSGQRRASSHAGSVTTSATVSPSPVTVTAVGDGRCRR